MYFGVVVFSNQYCPDLTAKVGVAWCRLDLQLAHISFA